MTNPFFGRMNPKALGWLALIGGGIGLAWLCPEVAMAFEFEARTHALTTNLITTVLPILSTLGLLYAAVLALTGDGGAKARIITVIVCSIVGFLAPHFIEWLKAAAGS